MLTSLNGFFERLARRAPLLVMRDPGAELDKLGLIRIVLGIVALARVAPIVYGGYFYFNYRLADLLPQPTAIGIVTVALLVAVTLGFATPLALAALLFVHGAFDAANQTSTLGSNIFALILLLMLLSGAGSRHSIDGALMRGEGGLGKAIARLYAFPGRVTAEQLGVLYFLLFAAFALISFGAVLLHAQDEYWRGGYTLQVMLTSSYLSRAYPFFREVEAAAPSALRAFSIVGSAAQGVFQLFMLPLIFTRWGGRFVVLWGLLFFLMSAILLELSYLPYLELLLWAALFVRVPARHQVEIFYDDYCNLCKRTMQTVKAVNALGTVAFRPASSNAEAAAAHGIDTSELYASLHGVYRGRVYRGYDLYRLVARRNPVLWAFAPILWLAGVLRMGPWLYALVARERRRIFGTCAIAYDANRPRRAPPELLRPGSSLGFGVVCAVFVALLAATLLYRFPYVRDLAIPARAVVTPALDRLGFDVPDVFNSTDLRMGDHWPVLYRIAADGEWELTPLHDREGRKLQYPRYVDILYFGNSLRWRRMAIGRDLVAFSEPGGPGYNLVQRVIDFDHRRRGADTSRYRVEIYRHSGSDRRRNTPDKYAPGLVHSYEVRKPR